MCSTFFWGLSEQLLNFVENVFKTFDKLIVSTGSGEAMGEGARTPGVVSAPVCQRFNVMCIRST